MRARAANTPARARGPAAALCFALGLGGCAEPLAGRAAASAERGPAATREAGAQTAAQAEPTAPARARRAVLQFELRERPFPSPLIDAVVGGQPATLLVDTGATHHFMARWLADELSLPLSTAGDVGIDLAGRSVQVSRIDHPGLTLAGWGVVDAPTLLVVPVPDVLQELGIGGFVAPQTLPARGRAVVLDLRAGEMAEALRDDAVRTLTSAFGASALAELRACGGPTRGLELHASATVEGIAVTLKIDSGATQSSLFAASPAGPRLAPRAAGGRSAYAASGKQTVPVLSGVRVRLGGFDASADVDLLPGAPRTTCSTDGIAGMDILRTCVLVLAEDGGVAACAQP
jgi:hypothetical protein